MMDMQVKKTYQYLIGVDGGGTGTRVVLADSHALELGRGSAGPSALMHGADPAWRAILAAVQQAFASAGLALPALDQIAIGCGLAGVNNKQWAADFTLKNPGFAHLATETDAGTTLLGAHQGQPGAIIALGTGSVGEVMLADGTRREVGGWGFPSSDEAGGAWLGLHAMNHAQKVLDGRSASDAFSTAVIDFCAVDKSNFATPRDAVLSWLGGAGQGKFASLAPLVIEYAATLAAAREIMLAAGQEVGRIAQALDPDASLPLALCGGLAEPILPYLPPALRARVIRPQADSAAGAIILLTQHLSNRLLEA